MQRDGEREGRVCASLLGAPGGGGFQLGVLSLLSGFETSQGTKYRCHFWEPEGVGHRSSGCDLGTGAQDLVCPPVARGSVFSRRTKAFSWSLCSSGQCQPAHPATSVVSTLAGDIPAGTGARAGRSREGTPGKLPIGPTGDTEHGSTSSTRMEAPIPCVLEPGPVGGTHSAVRQVPSFVGRREDHLRALLLCPQGGRVTVPPQRLTPAQRVLSPGGG